MDLTEVFRNSLDRAPDPLVLRADPDRRAPDSGISSLPAKPDPRTLGKRMDHLLLTTRRKKRASQSWGSRAPDGAPSCSPVPSEAGSNQPKHKMVHLGVPHRLVMSLVIPSPEDDHPWIVWPKNPRSLEASRIEVGGGNLAPVAYPGPGSSDSSLHCASFSFRNMPAYVLC